jgi:hypothetical protein
MLGHGHQNIDLLICSLPFLCFGESSTLSSFCFNHARGARALRRQNTRHICGAQELELRRTKSHMWAHARPHSGHDNCRHFGFGLAAR